MEAAHTTDGGTGGKNTKYPAPRARPALRQVTAFLKQHNPSKVGSIDKILFVYKGRQDELMADLVDKYVTNPAVLSSSGQAAATLDPLKQTAGGSPSPPTLTLTQKLEVFVTENIDRHLVADIKDVIKASRCPPPPTAAAATSTG
jgi:hypothetical protein